MVKHNAGIGAGAWLPSVGFSVMIPIVLFSAYLLLSRVAIPTIKGDADFAALFICAVAGAVPISRLAYPLAYKISFSFVHVAIVALLLVWYGFTIDCAFFHDCD